MSAEGYSLAELEARFLRFEDEGRIWRNVKTLAEADGVWFLCPKCYAENGGRVGTHAVVCWFVGRVPDSAIPGPGRWIPSGSGLEDLTFTGPAALSVLLTGGCNWHGFIQSGRATIL